jgi:hypothetical protein
VNVGRTSSTRENECNPKIWLEISRLLSTRPLVVRISSIGFYAHQEKREKSSSQKRNVKIKEEKKCGFRYHSCRIQN